jgi:hypothetical protein
MHPAIERSATSPYPDILHNDVGSCPILVIQGR